jgi:hypothetical protein
MKYFKSIYTLLIAGAFAFSISSCDEGSADAGDSIISSFETYSVTTDFTPVTVAEGDEDVITFKVALDPEKQVQDLTLHISVDESSTATEDVDFEIEEHDIDVLAFGGQDSIEIEVHILQDLIVEDGDETIVLTFSTEDPTGVTETNIQVATIEDSGLQGLEFTLRWEFADPDVNAAYDICDMTDVDFTVQTAGGDPYDDDLMGYDASQTFCPEHGAFLLSDMNDGEVYDMWTMFYGGDDFGDLGKVNVYIDFAKVGSTAFSGTLAIEDAFTLDMGGAAGVFFTIQRNGDVVTIEDTDGNVIAEGRAKSRLTELVSVTKP